MKANETKVVEEYCWAITQRQVDRAAAGHIPVCWNLNVSWTPLLRTHN